MKRLAEVWFLLTTALLPLKFGGLAVMPEAAAYFPDAWQAYLIVGWPTPVFGIAAAVSLLLNLAARGFRLPPCRTPAALLAALWSFGFLLLAGAVPAVMGSGIKAAPHDACDLADAKAQKDAGDDPGKAEMGEG